MISTTPPSSSPFRQWLIDLVSITLVLGLFYALWLGSHALFTPDEGRYSEVAREMVVTGDYVTPRLNGVVFLDKPALYYWLQASAIHLFGLKEWALRFWPALLGVFGCVITYIAGRILFNRRTGILSAVILATCPLYYGGAHYANLDLEVAVFISSALLCFIVAMHASLPTLRNCFLFSAYVFAGLAALTKGLIGIVFPAMIIGAWIFLLNRWNLLKQMRLISGLLIFTAIAIPWYIFVQKANPEFFQFFFVKQQVSRFLTTDHFNNRTPGWFYLPIVLAGIFPWSLFVFQALFQHLKSIIKQRQTHARELYLFLWLILIFTFFSIPKSKTIGYILPILPALALLIGRYLDLAWEKTKTAGIQFGWFAFLFWSGMIAIACLMAPSLNFVAIQPSVTPYLTMIALIFICAGCVTWVCRKKTLPTLFSLFTLTACALLLVISAGSDAVNQKSIKPLALQVKPQLQADDEIVAFYRYSQDLPIYLERRITIVADWSAKDIPLNDNWVRELWYGMPFQETKEWLINENTFWQRWNSDKRLFVFTDKNYYHDLQTKSKKTVYKIAEYQNNVLVSNVNLVPI